MDGRARLALALAAAVLLLAAFEARAQMSSAEVLAGYQAKLDTIKDMWLKGEAQTVKGEKFQAEAWLKFPNKLKLKVTGALGRASEETFVMDGTTVWGQVSFAGGAVVYKMDQKLFEKARPGGLNSLAQVDLNKALETLKKECAVAIGFSVRVDGKTMHVLNARTKPTVTYDPKDLMQASMPQVKNIRIYIDKEDMLLYRVDLLSTDIKPFLSITAREVKTNTGIQETVFKYSPPSGAAVLDLTKLFKLKGMAREAPVPVAPPEEPGPPQEPPP
jgi:outer membrane lipoprotein-sorting protein